MKKLLIVLLTVLLVTGCSKNKTTWSDIQDKYNSIKREVTDIVEKTTVVSKQDYQALLTELSDYIKDVEFSLDDDNQDLLGRVYKVAQYFDKFASLFDGNCAQQLLVLSKDVQKLCQSAYEGSKDEFNSIKENILEQIEAIGQWKDEEWSTIEKQALLTWEEVENQISDIESSAKKDLTDLLQLTEYELDDLKHTIIDNYDLIKDGISESEKDIANQMYEAAVKLEAYTKKINNEQSKKVKAFAKNTQTFIKKCYNKVLTDEETLEQDFGIDIENAKKWTQSTWNEITKDLKLLAMPTQQD